MYKIIKLRFRIFILTEFINDKPEYSYLFLISLFVNIIFHDFLFVHFTDQLTIKNPGH